MAVIKGNPYVGPRTFREDEGDRFFGREREARDLLSLVISERLVLFYAQSGAGKSSLINARLRPWLVQKGFILLPTGRVSGDLPKDIDDVANIFVFNLLLTLDQHSEKNYSRFTDIEFTDFLTYLTTTDGKNYYYDDTTPLSNDGINYAEPPHILIIDQFEELLTTHPERWQDREGFFRQLNQAMIDDPLLWVVLSMREDYIAPLDPYAPLLQGRMKDRFYMQRLKSQAALEAIKEPARLAGCPFESGGAEQLVNNLCQIRVYGQEETQPGQFVEPVQLQIVCYQLWEKVQAEGKMADEITKEILSDYNVDQALTQFYETAVRKVARQVGETEARLREWVEEQLITEAETRGTVYRGELESGGLATQAADFLVDQFLLRTENRAAATWYELVHDRFVKPILRSNEQWRSRPSRTKSPEISYADETHYVDLEIRILAQRDQGYPIEMTLAGQQEFPRGILAADVLPWIPSGDSVADGQRLFETLIADSTLREAWTHARGQAAQRRIRLWIDDDAPELHTLPWEILRDNDEALTASAKTPFSRYIATQWVHSQPVAERPLRLLVAISNPDNLEEHNLPLTDVASERQILMETLSDSTFSGQLVIDFLDPPITLSRLEQALARGYHFLHLVTHSGFSTKREQAALYLADDHGQVSIVNDSVFISQFTNMLERQSQVLQLISLAGCQSATRSFLDVFQSLGSALVAAGVPIVLAMQPLSASATRRFIHTFYHRLFQHGLVDLAANQARATLITDASPVDAMPILISRLRDNQILAHVEGDAAAPVIESKSFEPETVYIPAGPFLMGSLPGEGVEDYETPQHSVDLPAYRIGKYPVTNAQYAEFVRQTKRPRPGNTGWFLVKPPTDKLDHPVAGVTWYDALGYCQWLSAQTGRRYTLPSEAQWEKAARGTDGRTYPWGDKWDTNRCNYNSDQTTPVDAYPLGVSPFGCYDVIGNVREWTCSIWGEKHGKPAPEFLYPWAEDGRNDLETSSLACRVCRGGSAADKPSQLRCSARRGYFPDESLHLHGFRVVLEIEVP